jgi:hypothetical protein
MVTWARLQKGWLRTGGNDSAGSHRERVRLSAPLPDAVIRGVRYKRSGVVSGLIISDAMETKEAGTLRPTSLVRRFFHWILRMSSRFCS